MAQVLLMMAGTTAARGLDGWGVQGVYGVHGGGSGIAARTLPSWRRKEAPVTMGATAPVLRGRAAATATMAKPRIARRRPGIRSMASGWLAAMPPPRSGAPSKGRLLVDDEGNKVWRRKPYRAQRASAVIGRTVRSPCASTWSASRVRSSITNAPASCMAAMPCPICIGAAGCRSPRQRWRAWITTMGVRARRRCCRFPGRDHDDDAQRGGCLGPDRQCQDGDGGQPPVGQAFRGSGSSPAKRKGRRKARAPIWISWRRPGRPEP